MSGTSLPTTFSDPAKHILHPTDFSEQSDNALAHALRLALTNSAKLTLLHSGKDADDNWSEFPSIRRILNRWGMTADDAPRSAVTDLGIGIEKVIGLEEDVGKSVEGFCHRHPIDMIVLATAGRHGLGAWLKPSKAEQIAEKVSQFSIPTLFVPAQCRGCVAIESGKVTMENVLVPVDHEPMSETAIELGLRAIARYGGDQANLTLLHIGSDARFPRVLVPKGPWQIQRVVRQGNPAGEILAVADECRSNLIVMVTEGTDGILDVLRGTTTQQVLREAPCPILAVPASG